MNKITPAQYITIVNYFIDNISGNPDFSEDRRYFWSRACYYIKEFFTYQDTDWAFAEEIIKRLEEIPDIGKEAMQHIQVTIVSSKW